MWNKVRRLLKDRKTIIIFGCTELGKEILKTIQVFDINADIFFYDNALEKQGTEFMSTDVLNEMQLRKWAGNAIFILASMRFYLEMQKQLIDIGISENAILFPEEILEKKLKESEEIVRKRMPKKQLNFVVDLAEHCNLNCQNCDHFSPLAEEKFTDIEGFEKDIKRMSELLGDNISHIDLEGGEPLLNKNISEFVKIVHKYLPKVQVQVFTNGILLEKMPDSFWQTCKEHKVVLEVTKYPINFDYDNVKDIARQKGVELKYFGGDIVVKTSMHKPLDLEGKQDKYKSFNSCYLANGDCAMLKEGKLYGCTLIPNLQIFNKYFGEKLEVTQKDYIDIYEDITEEDIFEFLCNPTPACRYCMVSKWSDGHVWKTTKKRIEEWT